MPNGPIYELWWNPTGWHMDDLRAITGAPAAGGDGPVGYAFEAQVTQQVVYIGLNDRHVPAVGTPGARLMGHRDA